MGFRKGREFAQVFGASGSGVVSRSRTALHGGAGRWSGLACFRITSGSNGDLDFAPEEQRPMASMVSASFEHHFQDLPDPRIERARKHPLINIVFVAVCGVLCGANSYAGIREFAIDRRNWLAPNNDCRHKSLAPTRPITRWACDSTKDWTPCALPEHGSSLTSPVWLKPRAA